mgnify:CR=1 FL=1
MLGNGTTRSVTDFTRLLNVNNIDQVTSSFFGAYTPDNAGTIPISGSYGEIIQITNSPSILPGNAGNFTLQLVLSHGDRDHLFFRDAINTYGWNSWKKIATTADKLPTPYALTFTGAVTGTWDGSAAKTINIPASA